MINNAEVRIAGVTFSNEVEDGGESRQDLLKSLYNKPSIVSLIHTTFHNQDTNCEEKAIKVISDASGKCLGYIPKDDVDKFWNTSKMVLTVSKYKDTYSGGLVKPTPPSKKQYAFVKAKREEGILAEMPPYDKTIYQHVIANLG